MQFLIGIGLVILGAIFGFSLCSFTMYGKAQDIAREHLNAVFLSLKKGEIKIEDIEYLI